MKKSFTLIELLVAAFILITGILGVSFLISQQIFLGRHLENGLIAAHLAKEGIEIVRNIRDTNYLKGISWTSNLPLGRESFNFDYRSQEIPDPNCFGKNYLKLEGNFYQCTDTPNPLELQRKIKIESCGGDCILVRATIFWKEKGKTFSHSLVEKLYNWKP